ncbi:hypothetical protein E2C01_022455 [Portunus trituberculatus]|uniref:Uncharacterized protein n=1 Tax=Portunus trituberculatus TaxID=210409 RepID=A0A5B7E7S2_PORTR|nr:hypothetical protein [Portunus trituberculatus]
MGSRSLARVSLLDDVPEETGDPPGRQLFTFLRGKKGLGRGIRGGIQSIKPSKTAPRAPVTASDFHVMGALVFPGACFRGGWLLGGRAA